MSCTDIRIFLPSFANNEDCCPIVNNRQEKQNAHISGKAIDFQNVIPASLQNASEYLQELEARTGQLFRYYLENGCTKSKANLKISIELVPELKYFIEVCRENQQIFGGDDYVLFDRLF